MTITFRKKYEEGKIVKPKIGDLVSPGVASLLKQIEFKRRSEIPKGDTSFTGWIAPPGIPWCPICGDRPIFRYGMVSCSAKSCPLNDTWADENDWKSLSAKVWKYRTNLKKPSTGISVPSYNKGRLLFGFSRDEGIYDGSDVFLSEAFLIGGKSELTKQDFEYDVDSELYKSSMISRPRKGWFIRQEQAVTVINRNMLGRDLGFVGAPASRDPVPQLTDVQAWSKRVGLLFIE